MYVRAYKHMRTHPMHINTFAKSQRNGPGLTFGRSVVLLDFFRTDLFLSVASSLSAPPVFGSLVHLVTLLKVRKQMTSLSLPPIYICLDGHIAQGNA